MNISYSCNHTQNLRERLEYYVQNNLDLPSLISQSDILGFTDSQSENFIIINHLVLIFKYYIFKSRSNKHLSFLQLKTNIIKVKPLEEDFSNGDNNKSKKYLIVVVIIFNPMIAVIIILLLLLFIIVIFFIFTLFLCLLYVSFCFCFIMYNFLCYCFFTFKIPCMLVMILYCIDRLMLYYRVFCSRYCIFEN